MLKKNLKKPAAPVSSSKPPLKKTLSSKSTAAAPTPDESENEGESEDAPTEKLNIKTKEEAAPNEEVVALISDYDGKVEQAEQSFIALVEYIQENEIDRATVIASMMVSRGVTYETAQADYGKMKKIFNNEEVLQQLKAGEISLKIAKQKVTKKQANPAAAKPEAKEQKYNTAMKNFVQAAKESGLARREIMVSVEAELKSAGIK